MTDFLLELRSEEIPARMQEKARADLERLFVAELASAGLKADTVETYATPRRLALIARGLPLETQAVREETKGPRTSAPPQALEGFLRKTGLTRGDLEDRDGVWFAVADKPGRRTAAVLASVIPAIVRAFPWPKSMRWGDASLSTESLRWVRPLQGIVAIFGDDVVDCDIAGVTSGAATVGHRFHHPGIITIGGAHDYVEKLRACHVVVAGAERRAIIAEGAAKAAEDAGLTLVEDEGLLFENAGLTEWPVPLLGRFDADFLSVPPEVIQLTARVNQKYFVCHSATGALANAFVCTANIDAGDGGAKIIAGNEKVLAARLSDARFFYDTDLKTPLDNHARKLDKIVFHEKLGTVADKVDRVAKLARWLVEEGIVGSCSTDNTTRRPRESGDPASLPSSAPVAEESGTPAYAGATEGAQLADMAERAARLAKADLVTGMVGEFPELQGVIGGYYARAQGEPDAVADAVRDHYKPVGHADEVPTAPVTVAVSLADKLDTINSLFACGERPTGSKDPFALRRAALGALSLIFANELRIHLQKGWAFWRMLARFSVPPSDDGSYGGSLDFFADRLKVQQREVGVRHDLIDAVFALGDEDDPVRLLARVHALQAFVTTEDGANLLAGYKRAANILKKEGWDASAPANAGVQGGDAPGGAGLLLAESHKALSYTPENDEAALVAALETAEPAAADAVAREDFEGAMAALATLRAPIDAFFETVTVNDPDPARRAARLALLDRVRAAMHSVADFSKIEG